MKKGWNTECGPVKKVLATATILHNGWETDNEAWCVELEDGSRRMFMTSHGRPYKADLEEMRKKLAETEASAESIRQVIAAFQGPMCPLDQPDAT